MSAQGRPVPDAVERSDTYPAVRRIRPGRFASQVRDVMSGGGPPLLECAHAHRSRSAALRCATTMLDTAHVESSLDHVRPEPLDRKETSG